MGRDIIQLEDAVSTISEEYLLEFTSKYGIPEGLHPKLPGPEEIIVDFPEGILNKFTWYNNELLNTRITAYSGQIQPIVDELDKLKDARIDILMASLYLESDSGKDAPQWIRELCPSSSQLKIPVYLEGLAIVLADAATQTKDDASPRLLRSKSLPPLYNLD
ncbi:hypothetical protein Tco_1052972 [Tanacetum coccineum]